MRENTKNIVKAVSFALIPLAACVIYAALQGVMLWEIEPSAVQMPQWCDELYYYHHIECLADGIYPLGYMGYNESTASVGTLGAWSVFVYFPYVILFKLLGSAPYSIILSNIIMVTIAFGVFYKLSNISNFNVALIIAGIFAVPLFPRYILSGMTEPMFFSGIIIISGFLLCFAKGDCSIPKLILCYAIIVYLSLGRQYILAFMLVPFYYHFFKDWKKSIVLVGSFGIIFVVLYVFYAYPRTAPYFSEVVDLSLISIFIRKGPTAFIERFLNVIKTDTQILINLFKDDYIEVVVPYTLLMILLTAVIIYAVYQLIRYKKEKMDKVVICAIAVFIVIVIVFAMILFYEEYQSARHVISLCMFLMMVMGGCIENKKIFAVLLIVIVAFAGWKNVKNADYVYKLSTEKDEFDTMPIMEDALQLQQTFVCNPKVSNWENTVIYDYSMEEINNMTYLYYLPNYAGINICMDYYLDENIANLNSRYLLTNKESDREYETNGWKIVFEGKEITLYEKVR